MPDPRAELAQRIMGFMVSAAVYAVAKVDVAGVLGDRSLSVDELAAATATDADALYRVLRMLAAHGIFVETDDSAFANTETSRLLAEDFRDFALVFGDEFYPAFNELPRTLRDHTPSFEAYSGTTYYEHLASNRDASSRFNRFMASGKSSQAGYLAASSFWRGGETVVDVGGGNGALLRALLERRPELRGIVLDLPETARDEASFGDRLIFVAGSFFERVPGGDTYLLQGILHDWSDERATAILRTIHAAAPPNARLLVLESVVPPGNDPHGAKWLDLLMLVLGGRERDEQDWGSLLDSAGFRVDQLEDGLIQATCL